MDKIRVLVVDDAVVVRRMVSEMLSRDPALEVATAPNGRIALAKLGQVHPDLVLLDLEMPDMDGLQTLAALRKAQPFLPVIMFSRFTPRGTELTLDALLLGANDYVNMPENPGRAAEEMEILREQLIVKIKEFCSQKNALGTPDGGVAAPRRTRPPSATGLVKVQRVEILAIGASTGGPNALATLLGGLPANWPVPIVIVQHMPPTFTGLLADRLAARGPIPVGEAVSGEALCPGRAWIAPGGYHMEVTWEEQTLGLRLHQGSPVNSCRPSIDVLFRSVAETYGAGTLAVVLTGMGQDGLRGCERVREVGGRVLAQDQASSVVWGIPGLVARADLADQVLPLDMMATEISRRVRKGRSPSSPG